MIGMHFFMEKQRRRDEKVTKERAVLRLNIPSLQDYCMSPCNKNCELLPRTAFVLVLQPTHPTSSSCFLCSNCHSWLPHEKFVLEVNMSLVQLCILPF